MMTGAVSLAGAAAYRAGAGLVAVAVPEGILAVVQVAVREAVFVALPETARAVRRRAARRGSTRCSHRPTRWRSVPG